MTKALKLAVSLAMLASSFAWGSHPASQSPTRRGYCLPKPDATAARPCSSGDRQQEISSEEPVRLDEGLEVLARLESCDCQQIR